MTKISSVFFSQRSEREELVETIQLSGLKKNVDNLPEFCYFVICCLLWYSFSVGRQGRHVSNLLILVRVVNNNLFGLKITVFKWGWAGYWIIRQIKCRIRISGGGWMWISTMIFKYQKYFDFLAILTKNFVNYPAGYSGTKKSGYWKSVKVNIRPNPISKMLPLI